jgi:hypothetical protein
MISDRSAQRGVVQRAPDRAVGDPEFDQIGRREAEQPGGLRPSVGEGETSTSLPVRARPGGVVTVECEDDRAPPPDPAHGGG